MRNFAKMNRRALLQGMAATGLAATGIARPAFAVPKTLKIGLVVPQTGPLAFFTEHLPFTLEAVKKATSNQISAGSAAVPFEIIIKDSQSSPNRAAEVTQELILNDKVNVVMAFATPETVNPVSDQCELNGIPCLTNDAPIEPYFFGRGGDPKTGFDWTSHFFFSGANLSKTFLAFWNKLETNKAFGALWPNDSDGQAYATIFTELLGGNGYKIADPGRFDMPAANYSAQISAFKSGGCDIVNGVLPPPEFTSFWSECAQQGYKPRVVTVGKALEFPAAVGPLGDRAVGLSVEVWWSRFHPYASSLTGQSSAELADAYEAESGRQWSMPLGYRHALFEVLIDALKRTEDLDDPASIQKAIRATDYKSIVGPINFSKGPFPGVAETPLVTGQWIKGKKFPIELALVDNTTAPDVPVTAEPFLISV